MSIRIPDEKTGPKGAETKELPVIPLSIVIPAHNEEKTITGLLDLILKEEIDCEVIVSDSASSDKTSVVVNQYIAAHPDRPIHLVQSPLGVSNARNNGAAHARGEYILFLDADTRFEPGFIKRSLEKMKKNRLDIAGFNMTPRKKSIFNRVGMAMNNVGQQVLSKTQKPVLTGAAMMVARKLHQKIGGFPADKKFGEDSAYTEAAVKLGGKLGIIPEEYAIFDTTRLDNQSALTIVTNYVRTAVSLILGKTETTPLEKTYEKDRYGRKITDNDNPPEASI